MATHDYKAIVKDVKQEDKRIFVVLGFHVDGLLVEEQRVQVSQDTIDTAYIDSILNDELEAFIDRYNDILLLSGQPFVDRSLTITR